MSTCIYGFFTSNSYASPKVRRVRRAASGAAPPVPCAPVRPAADGSPAHPVVPRPKGGRCNEGRQKAGHRSVSVPGRTPEEVTVHRRRQMPIEIGQRARTPFEPSGLVEVVEIEGLHPVVPRQTVLVRYLEPHPHGYPGGTLGRYFADELRPLDPAEA